MLIRILIVAVVAGISLTLANATWRQQQPAKASVAIDHVALNVADLEQSVSFYSGVFGFEEIHATAKGRRWMSLGKGIQLHLLGDRTQPVANNRSVHLALTSDNLEPIMKKLKDRGVRWSDFAGTVGAISMVRTDGVRQIFFQDPDGYWIEVNDALKNESSRGSN